MLMPLARSHAGLPSGVSHPDVPMAVRSSWLGMPKRVLVDQVVGHLGGRAER
jgi:hypothetical protein